jgi:low affinity Fe/Cu permease
MSSAPSSADAPTSRVLKETRYSLKELLREVEHERRHSVLGLELVDQSEIRTIFKSRARRKVAKDK